MPSYLPAGQHIEVADNGSLPHEPMLFQILPLSIDGSGATSPMVEAKHPLGTKTITRVNLRAPSWHGVSAAMKRVLETDWMDVELSDSFHMVLEFDRCRRQQTANLAPILPLILRW